MFFFAPNPINILAMRYVTTLADSITLNGIRIPDNCLCCLIRLTN
jgi:hypothetical protein